MIMPLVCLEQIWTHNLQIRRQIGLLTLSLNSSIRSISWHTTSNKILVGTAGIHPLSSVVQVIQHINDTTFMPDHLHGAG